MMVFKDKFSPNKDLSIIKEIEKLGINVVSIERREVKARCPKHEDSTPSFFFNLDTQAFHCFAGCIQGRGIHQLIFQVTGVSQAGKPAIEILPNNFFRKRERDRKIIPSIPMLPLASNNEGERYLLRRGLTRETISNWELRYWEEKRAIVIPIDSVGYNLRYIDKGALKKYQYVSGTRITETLFGINHLNKTLTGIVLVEGCFDTIWLHQEGITNSLALLHADISQKQIRLLRGVSEHVWLMLDGDETGRKASIKIKKLLGSRFLTKICKLPEGKDPDNLSKSELLQIIQEAK